MYKHECDPHNTAGASKVSAKHLHPWCRANTASCVAKVGIFVPAGHDEVWGSFVSGPPAPSPLLSSEEGVKELCEEMRRSETGRWTFVSKSRSLYILDGVREAVSESSYSRSDSALDLGPSYQC